MVWRMLVRGHLRTRWRRYALVATSFGFGLFSFFLVLMVVQGAEEAIVRPIGSTLTGELRVTQGSKDMASGRTMDDYRALAAEFDRLPGARVDARLESNYITLQQSSFGEANYDNWSAGLLLGIDSSSADERGALGPYMKWGSPIQSDRVFDPETGKAYPPLVLGVPAVRRLNITLNETGQPDFSQVLTLTSGRTQGGSTVPFFLTVECVLVGVFDTGLEPIDKFTAFVPLPAARLLAGRLEGDPVANALIVRGSSEEAVESAARAHKDVLVVSAGEFAFGYMGSLLVVLYAAAAIGLGLFLGVLLVWLVHQTGALVRSDQAVVSSLQAIGIPSRQIRRGYASLSTAAVGAGAIGALLLATVLALVMPPIRWSLSGLHADIPWRVHPLAVLLVGVAAIVAAFATSFTVARRLQRVNILDGLRRA